MQKYVSTVRVFNEIQFQTMKPGQWVSFAGSDTRGQFLGITQAGVVVVRYQPGVFGAKRDTRNNATLRQYAKDYGAR